MKKNRLLSFFMFIVSMFVLLSSVNAAPETITISTYKDQETENLNTITYNPTSRKVEHYTQLYTNVPYFPVKHRSLGENENVLNSNVYCTSGLGLSAPKLDTECEYMSAWGELPNCKNATCGYGSAYIIHSVQRNSSGSSANWISSEPNVYAPAGNQFSHYDRYYWTEMLINEFLGTVDKVSVFGSTSIIETDLTYSDIVKKAGEYASLAVKPTITISGGTELIFEEKTDGYLYSNPITIKTDFSSHGDRNYLTKTGSIKEEITLNTDNKKFISEKQADGSYILKIAVEDVEPGTTEKVSLSINVNRSMYYSERYDCGTNYQAVTIPQLTTKEFKSSKILTGSVRGKNITKFSKISVVNQEELPGATLRILDENKEPLMDPDGNIYEWVSTDEPHYIEGLPAGKYYLQEIIAPEGYVLSDELVPFTIEEDGSVDPVIMENDLEVEVPDTLSSRSILLLVIGMIDIALGIGILLYVKKNKATE